MSPRCPGQLRVSDTEPQLMLSVWQIRYTIAISHDDSKNVVHGTVETTISVEPASGGFGVWVCEDKPF